MLEAHLDPAMITPGCDIVARNLLVDTGDLDEARAQVSRIFVDHRLNAPSRQSFRPVTISHCGFDALSLCYFDYGREVTILPDPLRDYYLMVVPIEGEVSVISGKEQVEVGPGAAVLIPAEREFRTCWSDNARQLIVRIDRRKLVRCLETHLGTTINRAPDFRMHLDWSSDRHAALRHAVGVLASLARTEKGPGYDLISASAEQTFLYSLLFLQPSDYTVPIAAGRLSTACPATVHRAEEYIREHLDQPISIADLIAVSGGSPRSLFDGFRQFRGVTPMRFVRQQRLHRARAALENPDPCATVANVAMCWGFQHLGRFAADYAEAFGEAPSQTLRRARQRTS
ncbi:MAG: AraC family transcriptional regulator [Pararhodobacter sp.]|nr:AraC family transcriptional regulator [Pararhodobacter sp.]